MDVDAETLRLAAALKMSQTACSICRKVTLFIANDEKRNVPMTCGRSQCMEQAANWKAK